MVVMPPTPELVKRLEELSAESARGVPVLGAELALAHTKQVQHYQRRASDRLQDLWTALEADPDYVQVVTLLTRYQLECEREMRL